MSGVKITYWQQLQDPRWQRKRLEILNRAEFQCECCADESRLSVHHRFYQKGVMAWEYPNSSLVAVCDGCHEAIADYERILLSSIDPRDIGNILDLAYIISSCRINGIGLKRLVDIGNEKLLGIKPKKSKKDSKSTG